MCLAAGRIFGRRFGIRQRPRASAAHKMEGSWLLGLPFAKHYREPSRVVAARRKEASRTVACRPFVPFCLRSRLPFLGRRSRGTRATFEAIFCSRWQHPRFPISEVAAPGCCSSMGTPPDGDGDDHGWPVDGVLPLLLPMPMPSTRLLINPLAPDLGPCSKPGRNEFAPPTSARPTPRAFSNPFPSPSSSGSRVK